MIEELIALLLGQATVEEVDVLLLAAENVDEAEALQMLVLEILKLLPEHDRARCAIAVE